MSLNAELLEQSFERLKPDSDNFTATFYATLFGAFPEVEPLFAHVAMADQGKKLFESLRLVIDSLHNPDVLSKALKGLGTRHLRYGVLPVHYPMVGAALLVALELHLQANWTVAISQAWQDAYGAVTQLMLEGADYPVEILHLPSLEIEAPES